MSSERLQGRCFGCLLRLDMCLCAEARAHPVCTRSAFLLLRHAKEVWKSTNTGRLAALAMGNLTLVDYGTPERAFTPSLIQSEGTWLLFPDAERAQVPTVVPRQVVVLDGTWTQAKRMVQRVPELRCLPRLALPESARRLRHLRRPPHAQSFSTLEAIARAVELLEGEAAAAPLFSLHEEFAERVLRLRGRLAD